MIGEELAGGLQHFCFAPVKYAVRLHQLRWEKLYSNEDRVGLGSGKTGKLEPSFVM